MKRDTGLRIIAVKTILAVLCFLWLSTAAITEGTSYPSIGEIYWTLLILGISAVLQLLRIKVFCEPKEKIYRRALVAILISWLIFNVVFYWKLTLMGITLLLIL